MRCMASAIPPTGVILTPGRFISRAISAQSGSTRRRWPDGAPACANSRPSRASSVTSSGNGHCNPAAATRVRLSWIVLRATPRRRPISRALTPSWRSRNKYRNCRIVSSRLAGIPISSSIIDEEGRVAVADLRGANEENRLTSSGGRLHLGMVAGLESVSPAGLRRNSQCAAHWPIIAPRRATYRGRQRTGLSSPIISRRMILIGANPAASRRS